MNTHNSTRMKKVMFVLHYGKGGKRWYDDGVMSLLVNGEALRYVVKDNVTYAMMSVTPDTMRACLETVFVDNWGLLKYLRKTVHLKKDAIVTLDLVCKKCVVTDHHLSDSNYAVLCIMTTRLSSAEYRKTRIMVSGSCPQLGNLEPQDALKAVKIPNSTFLCAVPKCYCTKTDEFHNRYKFVSNSRHGDRHAIRASSDGLMWEGPNSINREGPDATVLQLPKDVYPILIGHWGQYCSKLLEVPVTPVLGESSQKSTVKPVNYAQLKSHWGFTKKNDAKSVETAPVEILCYC